MSDKKIPKLICEKTISGVTAVRSFTTAYGDQGPIIKTIVGVGNPYWIWSSIPAGKVIGADFTNAPICSSDVAVNTANAAPLLADPPSVDPMDVLIYE